VEDLDFERPPVAAEPTGREPRGDHAGRLASCRKPGRLGIENRRQRIEIDLEAARAAMQSAEAAIAAQREATQSARTEAQAAVNTAMQAAQLEMDAKAEALNAALAKQVAEAEARIDQGRKSALGAVRQVAGETVEALLSKLGTSADAGKVQAAVQREATARGIA
jgi:F-type H+-transporting ATPase subunit b